MIEKRFRKKREKLSEISGKPRFVVDGQGGFEPTTKWRYHPNIRSFLRQSKADWPR